MLCRVRVLGCACARLLDVCVPVALCMQRSLCASEQACDDSGKGHASTHHRTLSCVCICTYVRLALEHRQTDQAVLLETL